MQDSEVEMQEDVINISETVDNVVPENQERIGASKDTAIVFPQCISINKYNIIIHVIIICSYMLLHVPVRVCHCIGTVSVSRSSNLNMLVECPCGSEMTPAQDSMLQ